MYHGVAVSVRKKVWAEEDTVVAVDFTGEEAEASVDEVLAGVDLGDDGDVEE